MFRRMIAIAMTAVLLACPVACIAGAFAGGDGGAARCCGRCHSVPSQEPAQPTTPSSGSGLCCLCKGAIAAKAVTLDVSDTGFAVPVAVLVLIVPLGPTQSWSRGHCETAHPLSLSGRMLRLEHCALTC